MEIMNKVEVLNPMTYFNTVAMEIQDICIANDFDFVHISDAMGWTTSNLTAIEKLNKKEIGNICSVLQKRELIEYLISFQKNYNESKKKALVDYKENISIYKKVKRIDGLLKGEFTSSIDLLGDISDFLGIENEKNIFEEVQKNIALYRISNFVPDNLNLYAWLKRGELDFYKLDLPDYNEELFLNWINSNVWKKQLTNVSYFLSIPDILREFGVGLVYTPYLEKTVHGAVRWFDGKPLVQISDKGKCLATAWYTLFHEFGHIIKHRNDEIFEGNLDLPKSKITKKEQEANAFAYEYLFNGDGLRKWLFGQKNQFVDYSFVDNTSAKFNVPKIFVAYWMKKAFIKSKTVNDNLPNVSF